MVRPRATTGRQIPIVLQRARAAQLDELRLSRPLTAAEQAEADSLAHRLYLRERRAMLAERGLAHRRPVSRQQEAR